MLIEANKIFPEHYLIMFDLGNLMCFKTGEKEKGGWGIKYDRTITSIRINYLRSKSINYESLKY